MFGICRQIKVDDVTQILRVHSYVSHVDACRYSHLCMDVYVYVCMHICLYLLLCVCESIYECKLSEKRACLLCMLVYFYIYINEMPPDIHMHVNEYVNTYPHTSKHVGRITPEIPSSAHAHAHVWYQTLHAYNAQGKICKFMHRHLQTNVLTGMSMPRAATSCTRENKRDLVQNSRIEFII